MRNQDNNRPSDFAATYTTNRAELQAALEEQGLPTTDIRTLEFTEEYALPIWFEGDIVAHQVGEVVVANTGNNHFVGLRRGKLDVVASFRVGYLEAIAAEK